MIASASAEPSEPFELGGRDKLAAGELVTGSSTASSVGPFPVAIWLVSSADTGCSARSCDQFDLESEGLKSDFASKLAVTPRVRLRD